MPYFIIVRYKVDGVADIISSEWLIGRTKCQIPSENAEVLMKEHVKPRTKPEVCWETHDIRIISKRRKLSSTLQNFHELFKDYQRGCLNFFLLLYRYLV